MRVQKSQDKIPKNDVNGANGLGWKLFDEIYQRKKILVYPTC